MVMIYALKRAAKIQLLPKAWEKLVYILVLKNIYITKTVIDWFIQPNIKSLLDFYSLVYPEISCLKNH